MNPNHYADSTMTSRSRVKGYKSLCRLSSACPVPRSFYYGKVSHELVASTSLNLPNIPCKISYLSDQTKSPDLPLDPLSLKVERLWGSLTPILASQLYCLKNHDSTFELRESGGRSRLMILATSHINWSL